MEKVYLIGIDLGTQGTKTALYTTDGRLVADSFEKSGLVNSTQGIAEENIDQRYASVLRTVKYTVDKAGIRPKEVAAIGIDAQMAGIVGIDAGWNAVTHYDSWLDTRCEKYIGALRDNGEDGFIRLTGCPVTYAHGPKILWWKNEQPQAYKKISKFIMMSTYIAGKMTGLKAEDAYIDYTHIHFSAFANVETMKWSGAMLNHYGIDRDKMPRICDPWKVVGTLKKSEAERCGLSEGIPVVAGCGDQAATSFGAGVVNNGNAFDVSGTASLFSCCVNEYKPDVKGRTLVYARAIMPGMWIPQAYINGGGLSIGWFKELFDQDGSGPGYERLEKEAGEIEPGSGNLIFIPHFQGRVCPNDPYVRGSFVGLNWVHKRGHMYRAVLESIGYEYSLYYSILRGLKADAEIDKVVSAGGGSGSLLFNRIKADILGVPYVEPARSDSPTLGCAVLAGYGAGIYRDLLSAIGDIVRVKKVISPDIANTVLYAKYAGIYRQILTDLKSVYEKLIKSEE